MKLKSKLIGILGTAVVATTALTTVVSCNYGNENSANGIAYNGPMEISPGSGIRSYRITGFSLWTPLSNSNADAIRITTSNSKVSATIVEGIAPEKDFNVDIRVSVADIKMNETFKFIVTK